MRAEERPPTRARRRAAPAPAAAASSPGHSDPESRSSPNRALGDGHGKRRRMPADPRHILVASAGVDHHAKPGVRQKIDDQIVDHAAAGQQHAGVQCLAGSFQTADIVGQQARQELADPVAASGRRLPCATHRTCPHRGVPRGALRSANHSAAAFPSRRNRRFSHPTERGCHRARFSGPSQPRGKRTERHEHPCALPLCPLDLRDRALLMSAAPLRWIAACGDRSPEIARVCRSCA